jgi:23S rRNA-/tRNA-specific pseudouridylate synthase
MKPRSKRNRKRPRSEAHALPEDLDFQVSVRPLELDGKPLLSSIAPLNAQWLRLVEPYPYTFTTFAKERWVGRTVLDVYSTEFGSYPKSYYEAAIAQGRILVSDQQVDINYVVKGGDVLSHTVHRHEPGVAVQSRLAPYVTVVAETEEVLVVDKPCTVPVHPCGGYHVQSLMNMLEKHYGFRLYTIHRLDRLTSGLVILGKTSQVAQQWGKSIINRNCQKIYLARVKGKFPLECPENLKRINSSSESSTIIPWLGEWAEPLCNKASNQPAGAAKHVAEVSDLRKLYACVYWIAGKHGKLVDSKVMNLEDVFKSQHTVDEWLQSLEDSVPHSDTSCDLKFCWFHLACPVRIAQHKDGICEAGTFEDLSDDIFRKSVKPSMSSFAVVSYDDRTDSTLLLCQPHTGRTHQLRLHLQHLGHPIANDPNYGGDMFYCNENGKEASKRAQDKLNVIIDTQDTDSSSKTEKSNDRATMTTATDVPATESEIQQGVLKPKQGPEESIHEFIRRTCVWCARCNAVCGGDRAILEFMIRSPGIWLHALQYSFSSADLVSEEDAQQGETLKSFRAPLPSWHSMS